MKILLLLLILFQSPQVIKSDLDSIVPVTWQMEDEQTSVCTGFYINPIEVVTAIHCLPDDPNTVVFVNGLPAKILRKKEPFALLQSIENKQGLPIRPTEVVQGEEVVSVGNALGMGISVLKRTVSLNRDGDFLLDGPIVPGMSGGPVIDQNGKVVGVNQRTSSVFGVACGAKELMDFVKGK